MAPRTVPAALACCALIPATAQASSRPNFPKTVTGTISGSYAAKKDGTTHKATWKISSVRFKLVHVRQAEGSWTGFYKVTGGHVSYAETQSGPCSWSVSDSFDLAPAMPKNNISTPLALQRSLTGHDTYDGTIQPRKRWNVTETCSYPGSEPTTDEFKFDIRNLFDTGSKAGKIGRAMKGRFVYKDDYLNSTRTFVWSLRPRR
jgi:hypothetical protein